MKPKTKQAEPLTKEESEDIAAAVNRIVVTPHNSACITNQLAGRSHDGDGCKCHGPAAPEKKTPI